MAANDNSKLELEDFQPLTTAAFQILLTLADGEKHGYAIMQETQLREGRNGILGPGTLYRTIKQLLNQRLIAESNRRRDVEDDDERRRYYRLTGLGEKVFRAETGRLKSLTKAADAKWRKLHPGTA